MEFDLGLEHLGKTWFIDLDGTLLIHNGYLKNGDSLTPNSLTFINEVISQKDYIIITTGRDEYYREETIKFLNNNGIRFNHIIFGLPTGPRIVVNDTKPDGTKTAYAISVVRDSGVFS
jgi:hypothetical protein